MTDRYTIGHGAGYLGRKPECWIRRDGSLSFPADITESDAQEYVRGFEDGRARRKRDVGNLLAAATARHPMPLLVPPPLGLLDTLRALGAEISFGESRATVRVRGHVYDLRTAEDWQVRVWEWLEAIHAVRVLTSDEAREIAGGLPGDEGPSPPRKILRDESTPEKREYWRRMAQIAAQTDDWPDSRKAGINVSATRTMKPKPGGES